MIGAGLEGVSDGFAGGVIGVEVLERASLVEQRLGFAGGVETESETSSCLLLSPGDRVRNRLRCLLQSPGTGVLGTRVPGRGR